MGIKIQVVWSVEALECSFQNMLFRLGVRVTMIQINIYQD